MFLILKTILLQGHSWCPFKRRGFDFLPRGSNENMSCNIALIDNHNED